MTDRRTGTLDFFNAEKGFGFIKNFEGKDFFVHITDINAGRAPTLADVLKFEVAEGDKGVKAVNVDIVRGN